VEDSDRIPGILGNSREFSRLLETSRDFSRLLETSRDFSNSRDFSRLPPENSLESPSVGGRGEWRNGWRGRHYLSGPTFIFMTMVLRSLGASASLRYSKNRGSARIGTSLRLGPGTQCLPRHRVPGCVHAAALRPGLTLVHYSAQFEPLVSLTD